MREDYKTTEARRLRKAMTETEKKMWHHLRNRQFFSVKFRRQFPVGPYMADFACMEPPLVVELDGGQHTGNRDYDMRRDHFINQQGFTILRFWNNDVLSNIDSVLTTIMQHIASPHPAPLPQAGEGAVTAQVVYG